MRRTKVKPELDIIQKRFKGSGKDRVPVLLIFFRLIKGLIMHVLIKNRQEGKTTQLMKWVADGVPLDKDGYPFWSRVVIVVDQKQHDILRRDYWARLEDFDHRVYTIRDIEHGRFVNKKTKYRIDNMDLFLSGMFPVHIDGFTMTADTWEEVPIECQNPECPKAGKCYGECARKF